MPRAPLQVLILTYRRLDGFEVAVPHRSDSDVWQFFSGGGEDLEAPLAAAMREGFEEAGLPTTLAYEKLAATATVPASFFAAWADWQAATYVVLELAYAVDVGDVPLVLSSEHDDLRWLRFDEAMQLVRYDSNRTALWELHERLYPSPRAGRGFAHAVACACTRGRAPER
jgi:dihydroneopterin triphosphate diphosphatase